jgi:hypothetical protein
MDVSIQNCYPDGGCFPEGFSPRETTPWGLTILMFTIHWMQQLFYYIEQQTNECHYVHLNKYMYLSKMCV